MKRIAFVALFMAVAFCLAAAGCYLPKTPTPHPGQTVGPGAAPPLGLVTPGITIPAEPSGTPPAYAQPPGAAENTPVPPSEITSVPPLSDTLTPSAGLRPTARGGGGAPTPTASASPTPVPPTPSPLAPTVFSR
jgi:hypothetical protein